MTKEFRELTSLLAKGMNFEENAVILGTGIQNKDGEKLDITIHSDGSQTNLRSILMSIIENYLSTFDDKKARYERDALLMIFAEDEKRRINEAAKLELVESLKKLK